ncbi:hypothetical protein NP233_g3890 [Leucocoprinus birnbaumii]|uniref:G domain-containing protein n=1 Tax=Leucocoprinus birnbaumii TaxID=56174 RepID=A0AAD5VYC7_9AGAR|nr:hypothetical protein NP233_g3890 [Leucocoprinus birnbaumii]
MPEKSHPDKSKTPVESTSDTGTQKHTESFFEKTEVFGKDRNIIVFGETGAGKSSIIRMLSDPKDSENIPISNRPVGCTRQYTDYIITLDGEDYTIWDTAGLNEGKAGTVPADVALGHLRRLVETLGSATGISLLVYCIRWSRYRKILRENYDLFSGIICSGVIPTVVVITGLEHQESMEAWWEKNRGELKGMEFFDHACITAAKGKKNVYEEEYEESIAKLRVLIRKNCLEHAWKIKSEKEGSWLRHVLVSVENYGEHRKDPTGHLVKAFHSFKQGASHVVQAVRDWGSGTSDSTSHPAPERPTC